LLSSLDLAGSDAGLRGLVNAARAEEEEEEDDEEEEEEEEEEEGVGYSEGSEEEALDDGLLGADLNDVADAGDEDADADDDDDDEDDGDDDDDDDDDLGEDEHDAAVDNDESDSEGDDDEDGDGEQEQEQQSSTHLSSTHSDSSVHDDLPAGWTCHYDGETRSFYYHNEAIGAAHVTRVISREEPNQ
jgi:hypothetical protein